MIDAATLLLVLGSIALVGATISLNTWLSGRVGIRAMAQLEEGYRQSLCGIDELGNKLMAMLDARAHMAYRSAAGQLGKPPIVRAHDAPVDPLPRPRAVTGSNAPPDPEAQRVAQRVAELEELAKRNGVEIASPADYGQREP